MTQKLVNFHGDVLAAMRVKQREFIQLMRMMEGLSPIKGKLRSLHLIAATQQLESAVQCAERYARVTEDREHKKAITEGEAT